VKIAASGPTSRLYRKLVMEQQLASSTGGWYSGSGLDSGKVSIYAVAADGVGLGKIEAAADEVIAEIREGGVSEAELERAKSSYLADFIYESDSQSTLARRYGWGLAVGRTVADVESWPEAIAKVTAADVKEAAVKFLDMRASVTGTMIPIAPNGTAESVERPAAKTRS
jgi:zinc protease